MTYDEAFFVDEGRVAAMSAEIVAPWVMDTALSNNMYWVIDIGCGTGEWVEAFGLLMYGHTLGIDNYAPNTARIPRLWADISQGIDCTGWDLAICLETAEHLPPESAEPLVAGLAKAGTVLFSAATPGQPGVDHVNCQPHEYWHGLFAVHGMQPEYIGGNFGPPVADFYIRNLFLYRREEA